MVLVDFEAPAPRADDALFAVGLLSAPNKPEWILESGDSIHMCCQGDHLTNVRLPKITAVTAANKAKISVKYQEGDIKDTPVGVQ